MFTPYSKESKPFCYSEGFLADYCDLTEDMKVNSEEDFNSFVEAIIKEYPNYMDCLSFLKDVFKTIVLDQSIESGERFIKNRLPNFSKQQIKDFTEAALVWPRAYLMYYTFLHQYPYLVGFKDWEDYKDTRSDPQLKDLWEVVREGKDFNIISLESFKKIERVDWLAKFSEVRFALNSIVRRASEKEAA